MRPVDMIDLYQRIAVYRSARKQLRASAYSGLFWGAVTLAMGASWVHKFGVNVFLIAFLAVGAFLLVVGLVNLVFPKPAGVIIDGVGTILVGLYNLAITALIVLFVKRSPNLIAVILGPLQAYWGVKRIRAYPYFRALFAAGVTEHDLKEMDRFVRQLLSTPAADASDVIEFDATAGVRQLRWKGNLQGDAAVFVDRTGRQLLFARKSEIEIETTAQTFIGGRWKGTFQVGSRVLSGSISEESLEKFERWKNTRRAFARDGDVEEEWDEDQD